MTRKYTKKKKTSNTLSERTASDAVAEELDNLAPNAALTAILTEVKTLNSRVEELSKENEKLKDALIQDPREGGKVIVDGSESFVLPRQKEPVDPGTFAVFRSPSPGFRQKLVSSKEHFKPNGESRIEPAIFAEFDRGVCILKNKVEIDIMRAIEEEKKLTGQPVFVEIIDEEQKAAAQRGELSSRSIKSKQGITTDTSLEELVI